MRELKKIDTNKSLSTTYLIFEENWSDKFNRVMVCILFGQFILLPIMLIDQEFFKGANDKFILHWIIPIIMIIGLYGIFRCVMERQLIRIETSLDRKEIKRIILNYAETNDFEIYRKSNDCILLNSPTYADISTFHKKTRIFFFKDNLLLFTVVRDNFKLDIPVMFTQYFIKHDLKKMFKKAV